MSNVLSGAIKRAGDKAMYNDYCKEILSCKQILSRILQETTDEFRMIPIQQVQEYIEGIPEISTYPVFWDAMANEKIDGSDTVSNVPLEGTTTFDIRFAAYAPKEDNYVKLRINVEAQQKFNEKYPLVTRGIYYSSRMISSQYGVEFKDSEYGKIKKIYSIWICMKAPVYMGNTIEKYYICKENVVGDTPNNLENYDKMVMVFVYLNSNCEDKCELTEMLNILFSKQIRVEEKIKKLKEKYGITFESDEKEVLRDMCDFAELLIEEVTEEVTAEVTAKVTAESVRNAAKMAKVLGTKEELIPSIISENYNISIDEVKAILCA